MAELSEQKQQARERCGRSGDYPSDRCTVIAGVGRGWPCERRPGRRRATRCSTSPAAPRRRDHPGREGRRPRRRARPDPRAPRGSPWTSPPMRGCAMEWVEGDAQALPFADASFDVVTSVFGCMFAPDHEVTAGQLATGAAARRPNRDLRLDAGRKHRHVSSWTVAKQHAAAAGRASNPPILWGTEVHLRDLFAGHRVPSSSSRGRPSTSSRVPPTRVHGGVTRTRCRRPSPPRPRSSPKASGMRCGRTYSTSTQPTTRPTTAASGNPPSSW